MGWGGLAEELRKSAASKFCQGYPTFDASVASLPKPPRVDFINMVISFTIMVIVLKANPANVCIAVLLFARDSVAPRCVHIL